MNIQLNFLSSPKNGVMWGPVIWRNPDKTKTNAKIKYLVVWWNFSTNDSKDRKKDLKLQRSKLDKISLSNSLIKWFHCHLSLEHHTDSSKDSIAKLKLHNQLIFFEASKQLFWICRMNSSSCTKDNKRGWWWVKSYIPSTINLTQLNLTLFLFLGRLTFTLNRFFSILASKCIVWVKIGLKPWNSLL